MKDLKIGVIIADKEEYAPLAELLRDKLVDTGKCFNKPQHTYGIKTEKRNAQLVCVNCGIGKVNAAAAAAKLAADGCDILLNYGLSGGISGVKRGELVIADRFLEHDFDLTMIGYKPCEKPGQRYIYDADARLVKILCDTIENAKCGTAVCGDRFICNEEDRAFLKTSFHAVSCDMETGAIAAVCDMAEIPFIAVRRISDDAGDDAHESYREMNLSGETQLTDAFYACVCAIVVSDKF